MIKSKRILCIDFDDVIVKTKPLLEMYLKIIEEKASEEYLQNLTLSHREGLIDQETFQELEREHYDYKDRVLEEVDSKYQGLIDYDKIISIENAYPNVIEYINYLSHCGYYDEVYIVSHHNVLREVEAKRKFISKYLPKTKYIPVLFHQEKYEKTKKRKMTNKAEYLKKVLKLEDINNFTLIDDSNRNGLDWLKANGFFLRFMTNGIINDKKSEITSLFPYDIIGKCELPKLDDGRKK